MFLTVKEAIARGKRMVNYPVYAIMALGYCIPIFLIYIGILPLWSILPGIFIGFLSGWLYWSFMITKWRLWAFENVRNVHELEKRAVLANLIWPANSFFEKTEIRSAAEREKWKILQAKFRQEDVISDDFNVPVETSIYYSRIATTINFVVGIGLTGFGLYGVIIRGEYLFEGILAVSGLFMIYNGFKQAIAKEAQIILNSKGIQTASVGFAEWKDVYGEEVQIDKSGKHTKEYLVYLHPKGLQKIDLSQLKTDSQSLSHLLNVYRLRSTGK